MGRGTSDRCGAPKAPRRPRDDRSHCLVEGTHERHGCTQRENNGRKAARRVPVLRLPALRTLATQPEATGRFHTTSGRCPWQTKRVVIDQGREGCRRFEPIQLRKRCNITRIAFRQEQALENEIAGFVAKPILGARRLKINSFDQPHNYQRRNYVNSFL